MHFTRKKILLLILMGGVTFVVLSVPMCAPLCPESHHGADFFQDANCTISSHSFVRSGAGLANLFILPLLGLFLIRAISSVPEGFLLSPYKPPRYFSLLSAVYFTYS
jgi:hypothetical protein